MFTGILTVSINMNTTTFATDKAHPAPCYKKGKTLNPYGACSKQEHIMIINLKSYLSFMELLRIIITRMELATTLCGQGGLCKTKESEGCDKNGPSAQTPALPLFFCTDEKAN